MNNSNREEAIAFYSWQMNLQRRGFPKKKNGSYMNIWELYDYWENELDEETRITYRNYASRENKK
jgi:hypothetical protein